MAVAYLVLGVAFGTAWVGAGQDWFWAPVVSAMMCAGAAQFALVGLLANHGTPGEIIGTCLAVNLRHLLYGGVRRYIGALSRVERLYVAAVLTDETYALIVTGAKHDSRLAQRCAVLPVAVANHVAWCLGGCLGAVGASGFGLSSDCAGALLTVVLLTIGVELVRGLGWWLLGLCTISYAGAVLMTRGYALTLSLAMSCCGVVLVHAVQRSPRA